MALLEARHAQSLSPSCTRRVHIRYFSNTGRPDAQSDSISEVRVRLENLFSIPMPWTFYGRRAKTEDSPWQHVVCKHCSI